MEQVLLVDRDQAVATVTFNRPYAMNALSQALRAQFGNVMAELDQDNTIRVVILTGAGTRAFTAGLDLKELGSDLNAMSAANATSPAENPVRAIEQCRKPVIGAVNGVAITGGFEVALACDVLIASSNARFADTHVRVGIMPGWGLSQKLSRLIGIYRARELAFTGNFLDAETARAWALVNRIVPPEDLLPAARRLAADMASADPAMLIAYKKLMNDGFALAFGEALAFEHATSTLHNTAVTPQAVEARRGAVQARSRAQ